MKTDNSPSRPKGAEMRTRTELEGMNDKQLIDACIEAGFMAAHLKACVELEDMADPILNVIQKQGLGNEFHAELTGHMPYAKASFMLFETVKLARDDRAVIIAAILAAESEPCEHEWAINMVRMPEGYEKPMGGMTCLKCKATRIDIELGDPKPTYLQSQAPDVAALVKDIDKFHKCRISPTAAYFLTKEKWQTLRYAISTEHEIGIAVKNLNYWRERADTEKSARSEAHQACKYWEDKCAELEAQLVEAKDVHDSLRESITVDIRAHVNELESELAQLRESERAAVVALADAKEEIADLELDSQRANETNERLATYVNKGSSAMLAQLHAAQAEIAELKAELAVKSIADLYNTILNLEEPQNAQHQQALEQLKQAREVLNKICSAQQRWTNEEGLEHQGESLDHFVLRLKAMARNYLSPLVQPETQREPTTLKKEHGHEEK